jgi:hypothetical protein
MWTSCERRWQNDRMSDGSSVIVTCNNGVLKALFFNNTISTKQSQKKMEQ